MTCECDCAHDWRILSRAREDDDVAPRGVQLLECRGCGIKTTEGKRSKKKKGPANV